MICENCGAQIEDEVLTVYCKNCGHKILKKSASGTEAERLNEKKTVQGRRKWYFAAAGGTALLAVVIVLLITMQGRGSGGGWPWGSKADAKTQLYGEWSDEAGLLSMTFKEDGTVHIGAGSGFLGADLFTFTEEGGNTLYLKANADGLLGKLSLKVEYEMQGDRMKVSFLGTEYSLKRK